MNEPVGAGAGQQTGGTPPVGDQTGTGGGDQQGGDQSGASPDMTSQQMMDKLSGILGADAEGISEDEAWKLRQDARNYINDAKEVFKDQLPDATNGMAMDFIEGMMASDPAQVIKAVIAAQKVASEKQENEERTNAGDLHVQQGGSGKSSEGKAPKSMGESILAASDLFK